MWIPRAFVALTTVLLCTDAFVPSALRLCGSGASFLATKGFICNKRIDAHSPSMSIASGTRQRVNFVDEAAELEKRAFPILPQELVEKAKAYLAARGGFQADPEMMASNFQFMGPVRCICTALQAHSTFV